MKIEPLEIDRSRLASIERLTCLSLAGSPFLAGCSHGPEYSIFGSFFPVWIFCSIAGLLLAVGVRTLVARTAIAEHIAAPVLCYLCIAIFFACMLWLPFYS